LPGKPVPCFYFVYRRLTLNKEHAIKPLFVKDSDTGLKLLVFGVLSLCLIFADFRFRQMDAVRSVLTTVVAPIQIMVDKPSQIWRWANRTTTDYQTLHDENQELKAQALILQRKLQKLTALNTENVRLRELLNASAKLDDKVMVAEVIGVDPDPFTHEVVINKGLNEGVALGQPLLDAYGVMGQVIGVSQYTSRVMLITDPRHSVPVQDNRSGVRAIAVGQGQDRLLALQYIPDTSDIQVGDVLLSSGLGARFPAGYPVAEVTEVTHDPGQAFAEVLVTAVAHLHRSRQVLLVREQEQPASSPATVTAQDSGTGGTP